jgi:hypothetical protein
MTILSVNIKERTQTSGEGKGKTFFGQLLMCMNGACVWRKKNFFIKDNEMASKVKIGRMEEETKENAIIYLNLTLSN